MRVIKIGAVWCKECLVMRPLWKEIEGEMPELRTEYFDADENPDLLEKYGIKNIPSFIFLDKNDNEILCLNGMQDREGLLKAIQENIDK